MRLLCKPASLVALLLGLDAPSTKAANLTWSGGGGNSSWSTGTNWAGTAPVANDALFFGGSTQLVNSNNLTSNTAFAGMTFNSGAGAFTLSGNAITLNGTVTNNSTNTQTINLAMTMNATRTFAALSGNLSIGGILSGTGGLTKTGNNVLLLSGANTYSGTTTVSAGTLRLGNASALGSTAGITTLSGGALDLNGQIVGNETVVFSAAASLVNNSTTAASLSGNVSGVAGGTIMGGSGNLTLSGVVTSTGNGAWFKTGNGTLTLTGNNTFTRALTIGAGVVNIQSNNALGAANTNAVTVNATAALEMQGNITSSSKNLILKGNGTANSGALRNISGNNTYGGNIILGSTTRINSDSGTLTLSSGKTLTGAFALAIGGTGNTTIARVIGIGTGTLTKDGSGTLTLSAANTYTGLTTVSAGTLAYGINNALSTGAVRVNGGILDIQTFTDTVGAVTLTTGSIIGTTGVLSATSFTFNGTGTASANLGGNSAATKSGAGTTTILSGNNTFTRNTTISSGVLNIRSNTALGTTANGTTVASGASLEIQNNITVGAEALTLNGTGVASGGALRNVSGNNTYQGNIILTGATRINSDSGTLTLSTGNLTGAFAMTVGGTGNTTISRVIGTGAGALTKDGAGTLTLSGNNTYTGITTISSGILSVSTIGNGVAPSNLGNATNSAANLVLNGGALQYTGALLSTNRTFTVGSSGGTLDASGTGALTLTASPSISGTNTPRTLTLTGTNTGNNTLSGVIANNGTGATALSKTGSGTWVLTGNNTYSGGTVVLAGSLIGTTSSLQGDITNNGAVVFNQSANGTYSGAMSGTGSLTKDGSGTVALSGANNYSGPTTVTGGTLLVTGSTGSGAVAVASGATLGGTGFVGGETTVEGIVAPGAGGLGTLNVANTLTWKGAAAAGSNTNWIFELGAGNTSDLLSINGDFVADIASGSVFRFDFGGSMETGTFTLVNWSGVSTGFNSDSFSYNDLGAYRLGVFELTSNSLQFTISAVPEPSTWVSMAALFLGGGFVVWRRRAGTARARL